MEAKSRSSLALQCVAKIEASIQQVTTVGFTLIFHILLPSKELKKKMKLSRILHIFLIAVPNQNSFPSIDIHWQEIPWKTKSKIFWCYLPAHSRESTLTGFYLVLRCQVVVCPWAHSLCSLCSNLLIFYKHMMTLIHPCKSQESLRQIINYILLSLFYNIVEISGSSPHLTCAVSRVGPDDP